jgi:hypothetical protein
MAYKEGAQAYSQQNWPAAEAAYRRATEADRLSVPAWINLAAAQVAQKKGRDAEGNARKALALLDAGQVVAPPPGETLGTLRGRSYASLAASLSLQLEYPGSRPSCGPGAEKRSGAPQRSLPPSAFPGGRRGRRPAWARSLKGKCAAAPPQSGALGGSPCRELQIGSAVGAASSLFEHIGGASRVLGHQGCLREWTSQPPRDANVS